LVIWLVDYLVGCLLVFGFLVGYLDGWLIDCLVGCLVD
jgi:hypothetical protein